MSEPQRRSRVVRRAAVVVGVVVVTAAAWSGYQGWSSWRNVETVEFDTESAREALGSNTSTSAAVSSTTTTTQAVTTTSGPTNTTTTLVPTLLLDRSVPNTFLVMGTDESTKRADVILLVMLPPGSGDAVMVSIPRDLYVNNPCWGFRTKINENLWGCPSVGVSGAEQLAVAIEDFTGIKIDHFAKFTFPGFKQIINRVGGVEVCVGDLPIRDLNEDFDNFRLPAGCSTVGGDDALAWVRSRKTQHLTASGWQTMPGVNDLTRNSRQQEMLLAALDQLKQIRSLPELQGLVEDVSNAFTIDENLGLGDAIALLWDVRTVSSDDVYRVALKVRSSTSDAGASILLLTEEFQDTLVAAYPKAFEFFDWSG